MKQDRAIPPLPRPAAPACACDTVRAVVIHGHAHAVLALAAVPRTGGVRLLLLSAPGAAGFLGPAWWAALMADLAPRMTARQATGVLDCGIAAGRAMEALRIGLRHLVLLPECPQHAAVLARAAALGAEIACCRPQALDLSGKHADRQLDSWLAGAGPPAPAR